MQLRNILGALALSSTAFAQYNVQEIYQFENSFSGVGYVNVENIAVRPSNQQLLLNLVTGALMVQLNPDNPVPELLVNISAAYPGAPGSLTGIQQTGHEQYTVAAGNFRFGPSVVGGVAGVPGSFSVWNVDLSGHEAKATKLVDIPEAGLLNGITKQPGKKNCDYVLIADSGVGAIWRVNVKTGAYSQYFASPLFATTPFFQIGINGIKSTDQYLYFTNSAQAFFGAVPLNSTGQPAGPAIPFVFAPNGTSFDDFALDSQGNAYVASSPNAVYKLERENPNPILIAGGGDSETLLGPTACAFRGNDLYVTTGGQGGPMPLSGQVVKIANAAGRMMRKWVA